MQRKVWTSSRPPVSPTQRDELQKELSSYWHFLTSERRRSLSPATLPSLVQERSNINCNQGILKYSTVDFDLQAGDLNEKEAAKGPKLEIGFFPRTGGRLPKRKVGKARMQKHELLSQVVS